jgi:hypothetical protein
MAQFMAAIGRFGFPGNTAGPFCTALGVANAQQFQTLDRVALPEHINNIRRVTGANAVSVSVTAEVAVKWKERSRSTWCHSPLR